MAQVIEQKLRDSLSRSPEQFGFSPGHGTRDNVFILSTLFDKYIKMMDFSVRLLTSKVLLTQLIVHYL